MRDDGWIFWVIFAGIAAYVFWPDNSLEAQVQRVGSFFAKNQVGSNRDYGLFKNGLAGKEHVATVHGFMDDWDGCRKFAERLNQETTHNPFVCEPLN